MAVILKVLLVLIEVVAGVLLVGIILLQKSKDEGLGLAFGAGVGETLFGSRAGNVLQKITVGLAVVFLLNTSFLCVLYARTTTPSLVDKLPAGSPAAQGAAPANRMPTAMPGAGHQPAPVPVEQPTAPAPVEQPAAPAPVAPAPAPTPAPAPATP